MTTICSVKYNGQTAIAGDGQVTLGKSIIAKTTAKARTAGGGVKNVKNGGYLVGTPEKVRVYDSRFEELPLQP